MAKFTVRISGTAPVWADVEIEAADAQEAYQLVTDRECSDYAYGADWEICEGGNGVDDWDTTGDVYDAEGNAVIENGELLKELNEEDEDDDEEDEDDDEEDNDEDDAQGGKATPLRLTD